jgi:2-dehydro-3-deoxy-L-rhamnonate dehydrogenase (NAD+)
VNRIDLEGRVAVVTGGAKGLGMALTERLLASGASVSVWDRFGEVDRYGFKDILSVEVDVSDHEEVSRAVETTLTKFGKIDILVNNAGIAGPTAPLWEYPVDQWRRVVEVDLVGVFNCCRAVLPSMIGNRYGRIVNVSSIAGKEGNATSTAYSAAKAGVIALTKATAKEVATLGVLINAIVPAAFESEIWQQTSEGFLTAALAKIPMGRLGRPHEFASLAAWLCSEECSFSTGAAFDLSGGRATY